VLSLPLSIRRKPLATTVGRGILLVGSIALVGVLGACGPNATAQPNATGAKGSAAQSAGSKPGDAVSFAVRSGVVKQYSAPPPMQVDQNKQYAATIETSLGSMKAELFVQDAPVTVNNFVFLARDGYYDGVAFHRLIKGFMAQTGDPKGDGTGGPGYRFQDEPVTRKYERGTLAMANAGANTNGSQFFIIHQDYPLQPNYTIFGKVNEGLDALDKILNVPVRNSPRGEPSVPTQEVRITSVSIEEK
jgi:cyclophilin family peptidyl-prolyl cis-trans isomerase